jgi:hypothetical protein
MMLRRFVVGILVAFGTLALFAEDGVISRNAHLRESPSTTAPSIRVLLPQEEVEILDAVPKDGFLHVETEDNQQGWVWSKFVHLVAPAGATLPAAEKTEAGAATSISEDWEKPDPKTGTFTVAGTKCGPDGSGDKRDKGTNLLKNRTDIPASYHAVTWRAIADLFYPTPSPKSREDFTAEQLAPITKVEGAAIETVGYVVAIKPQKSNSESCNCALKGEEATDWHIALVEHPGDGEASSVVMEPTPRIKKKHPKWTTKNLAPWQNTDVPVRVSGWLLFDPQHRNHLKKYRSTLWEIHPITKIEVWDTDTEQWVDLDKLTADIHP